MKVPNSQMDGHVSSVMRCYTQGLFNTAMEHGPFVDDDNEDFNSLTGGSVEQERERSRDRDRPLAPQTTNRNLIRGGFLKRGYP